MRRLCESTVLPLRPACWPALLWLVLFTMAETGMATVAVDAVSTNAGTGSLFTHAHTVSGSERLLVVAVQLNDGESVESITYAGLSLAQVTAKTHTGGQPRIEIWRLIAPPTGSANVVVNLPGGISDRVAIGAVSYTGVDQTTAVDAAATREGTSINAGLPVSSRVGDLVQDVMASMTEGTPSNGPTQTETWNLEMGGLGTTAHHGAGSTQPGKNIVSMTWSLPEVGSWVSAGINVCSHDTAQTVLDEFGAIMYGGNDGTRNFSDDWEEIGESDGPAAGLVQVAESEFAVSGNALRIGGSADITSLGIMREADLSCASSAELSFTYRRQKIGGNGGSVNLSISSDGGDSWENLKTYNLNATDGDPEEATFDVTSYAAPNTQIRFLGAGGETESYFHVDNVQIAFAGDCGNEPPVLNPIGPQSTTEGVNLNFAVSATDAESTPSLSTSILPQGAGFTDNEDGTGSFNWTPVFPQAGNYNVTFYATDDASAIDSETVLITVTSTVSYIQIEWQDNTVFGDTSLTTDNDTTALYCRAYTSGDSLLGNLEVNWIVAAGDPIGNVHPESGTSTELELTTQGTARVVATYSPTIVDSTGIITCQPGLPAQLLVEPDAASVDLEDTRLFVTTSYDADGNESVPQVVTTWGVLGDVGSITVGGLFTATTTGTGYVTASGGGLADTATVVVVGEGVLDHIIVSPDTATVAMGDSLTFIAYGYDIDSNLVDVGEISWHVLGNIGSIDAAGHLLASKPGYGRVIASSSLNGAADTSGIITVETVVSTIPLGSMAIRPGQIDVPILAFRIDNYLGSDKSVRSITVRDASRGLGSQAQRLSNIATLNLYLDDDQDSSLTGADSLLTGSTMNSGVITLDISPVNVPVSEGRSFIFGISLVEYPTDGDSLDLFLVPATDIETVDGSTLIGPDTVNSLGYDIVDGLVAEQLVIQGSGLQVFGSSGSICRLLTIDIPRNGYLVDTLQVFGVRNDGSGSHSDVDSMLLFRDNGDGVWTDHSEETHVGVLSHTGEYWIGTGLSMPLTDPLTRFHIGAWINPYPANGATFSLSIPESGLDMTSQNDGPIDSAVVARDTVMLAVQDALSLQALPIPATTLTPGELSGPILNLTLANTYGSTVDIEALTCSLLTVDPDGASRTELDSQVDSLLVFADTDQDHTSMGPNDTLLSVATVAGGVANFLFSGLFVSPSGGSISLTVSAAVSLRNAKDGNTINLQVADSSAVDVLGAYRISGPFPLSNDEHFTIDAFPLSAVTVNSIDATNLFGGQEDQVVLDFELPRNGYDADQLRRLRLVNTGKLDEGDAVSAMKLWMDHNGNGYSPDDPLVGELLYSGTSWQLTDAALPLEDPTSRLFVTVSLSDDQFIGGTLQLQIPRNAIGYVSGLNGPDDDAIESPETFLIFPSNRVTVISVPAPSANVHPGASDIVALTFALYNGYINEDRSLRALTLANTSRTSSTRAYADFEMGQVSLVLDEDASRTHNGDPLLATGHLVDGFLQFTGLDVVLPPEALSYFFVVADLPLNLIDSDSLAVSILSPSALSFDQQVNVNGDLPLTRGGYLIADGSVSEQYSLISLASQTLSPGDTSAVLFAFRPARNGDIADTLKSVAIHNAGDADHNDLFDMELWNDLDGNGTLGGADSLLGGFTHAGGVWSMVDIDLEIIGLSPALLVVGDVGQLATPNTVFQGELPMGGCCYSSENDGPIDQALTSFNSIVISNSTLRLSHVPVHQTYSVGDTIDLTVTVTNLSATTLDSVYATVLGISDPTAVSLTYVSAGPVSLAAGGSTDLVFRYETIEPASVIWSFQAVAPTVGDSSATIGVGPITIQTAPTSVMMNFMSTVPASVTTGQVHVFPFSLSLMYADTMSTLACLRVDSLRVKVEDASGTALSANRVFSRLSLSAGYSTVAVLDNVSTETSVLLIFENPVTICAGQERLFSLMVDISDESDAGTFRLVIEDESSIPVVDENSLQPVSIDGSSSFPLRTATCRIELPAEAIAVGDASLLNETVNYGQSDFDVLQLNLRHLGPEGTAQIQLTGFAIQAQDSLGDVIRISELCDEVRVTRRHTIVGELTGSSLDTTEAFMVLSLPLTLSPGEVDSLKILASAREDALHSMFRFLIADSTDLVARDLSSGSTVAVTTDTSTLATGSVFPIVSDWSELRLAALPCEVCLSSWLPASIVGGTDTLLLMDLKIVNPASEDYSPVRLRQVTMVVSDSLSYALPAEAVFDRIGYRMPGEDIEYQQLDPFFAPAVLTFADTGLLIHPGDSLTLDLVADIEADVPYDHFVLTISGDNGIALHDATDTNWYPGLMTSSGCASAYPFSTGSIEILLPAGRPLVRQSDPPTQLVFRGQSSVVLMDGWVDYRSPTLQGDVSVLGIKGQILQRVAGDLLPVVGERVFEAIYLVLDDQTVAADSSLTDDSLHLVLAEEYIVSRDDSLVIKLLADIKPTSSLGNYLISFDDSTFLDIRDRNLATVIYPVLPAGTYPIMSSEISLAAASLGSSFTNYPNPFTPAGDGETTIDFILSEDARVDIEMFTIMGEVVRIIADNSFRVAAQSQGIDTWDGRNEAGHLVLPGTYFCRLTARYVSGRTENVRRKIAVIR